MNIAKTFLISIIFLILIKLLLNLKNNKIHIMDFINWLIFWIFALAIIIYPEITQKVADFIGIGRGADLVIYTSIISLFFLFFNILVKFKQIDEKITKLGREVAINNALEINKK